MEYSDHNIQPEESDFSRVGYLLDSAALAEEGGNSRLAIHLYCAAFEASQDSEGGVDERTLSGLRHAWTLACEQGDRSTAETIFNDLAPYNSDEQTRTALAELQEMAIGQLGLKKSEMEDMAIALADEMRDAGIDIHSLAERLEDSKDRPAKKIDLSNISAAMPRYPLYTPTDSTDSADSAANAVSMSDMASMANMAHGDTSGTLAMPDAAGGEYHAEDMHREICYADLAGFEGAKKKMQAFGIIDPKDIELYSFFQQAESFHGVSGPVLTQSFLFTGPSREDCGIFAQATANEIGWPAITMIVDVNEFGDGTIKVVAPIKRSIFGPLRITDLPNPCTVVIQNIDILQELFWNEEQAANRGEGHAMPRHAEEHPRPQGTGKMPGMSGIPAGASGQGYQRSLQHEILGYLGALFSRGGVFFIATSGPSSAESPLVLGEQLEVLLGPPAEIIVDAPNLEERQRVLDYFSEDHPSFHDVDKATLACLSDGMSRYEIMSCCCQAVEDAYSKSLRTQCHQMVSIESILTHFTHFLAQDSITYRLVEDYLVALFSENLEIELLQLDIIPNQISLDLEDFESEDGNVSES